MNNHLSFDSNKEIKAFVHSIPWKETASFHSEIMVACSSWDGRSQSVSKCHSQWPVRPRISEVSSPCNQLKKGADLSISSAAWAGFRSPLFGTKGLRSFPSTHGSMSQDISQLVGCTWAPIPLGVQRISLALLFNTLVPITGSQRSNLPRIPKDC